MIAGARWIRVGAGQTRQLAAIATVLVRTLRRKSPPIVLWSDAGEGNGGTDGQGYAVVATACVAPGRETRWTAWAMSPALAVYREFGLRTYLDSGQIWLNGASIARAIAQRKDDCAIVTVALHLRLAHLDAAGCPQARAAFRTWLREGLGVPQTLWNGRALPVRSIEAALRARFEAQHGWQFENSWFCAAERRLIREGLESEATLVP